ncbi:MAG TPA: hypothetical protein VHG10_08130 [Glycomyces sp.]|nr:hypothetical protein [Glycomyces sp.]
MSDNQKGTVVDFTDDPQKSTFGRNADGGLVNDPGGNAWNAVKGNAPLYAQFNGVKTAVERGLNPPQPYFHGESWEVLLNAMQAAADIGLQVVDAFDYGKAIGNAFTGNFLDVFGTVIAAVCKGILDWLWNSFQPVQDAAGVLLGNPGKIKNSGAMWNAVSENLTALQEAIGQDLATTLNECWEGEAGCGAAVRSEDLLNTVGFAAQSAKGLYELLEIYGDMAERVNDMVRQMIADLTSVIITSIGDIMTKGPLAAIPIAIDLAILAARYLMRLIGIGIQVAWFAIAGVQLFNTIKGCFDQAMEVLQKLSGYNHTISV